LQDWLPEHVHTAAWTTQFAEVVANACQRFLIVLQSIFYGVS